MQKFLNFLAEDKERQAKAKSFGGDMDALSAYARESGFEVSAQELREFRESTLKFLEAQIKKA
ncbi:MAG: Nif11 family protein, partial [Oscillospiraceae bacterium]|nr:Nif11 family protein [Oscillospiraceae bacterium]